MTPKFSTLVAETITKISSETISTTSREVVLEWLKQPDYAIPINFRTGKPDTKAFCQKIYSNFSDLLVRQEKNPAKYKNFATVDKEGPSKVFPEQLKAARGMKAVFEWLNANIDSLEYNEVAVVIDGKEVIRKEPRFKDVDKNEKEFTKVLSEITHLSKSEFLTAEERTTISKISIRLMRL